MKTSKLFQWVGLICFTGLTLMGCEKDGPSVPAGGKGDLAVVSMLTNADGQSGTAWLQLIKGISLKTVDNSPAYQIGFGMPPMAVMGNDIFTMPDYGQSNTFQRWTRNADGMLAKGASLELPVNSFAIHGVIFLKEKAYLATMTGKILIFNPSEMTLTGSIDISSYAAEGVAVPYSGSMFIDGETMYVPLWQVNSQRQPIGAPLIDMLIIDVKTDKVLKHIQEKKSGLTNAGYPYGIQKNVFKDEKGDIYYVAGGSFSVNPEYKTGILRIKKGTQEIDTDYNWVFNDQFIEGETGKAQWLVSVHYLGNGKLYGMMDIPNYWADPKKNNWLRDRSVISVEIDIYAKTVKRLPIPNTCCYATHIAPYDDLLLFSVWGEKSSGFYTYDPKTGKTSSEAVIKMSGFPFWCYQFK